MYVCSTDWVMVGFFYIFILFTFFFNVFIISVDPTGIVNDFWAIGNEKLFERKPLTVDELKEFISQAFKEIDANWSLCVITVLGTSSSDGRYFKQLRDIET